jgi:hypothetical protein
MRRREFIGLLGNAAGSSMLGSVVASVTAEAQQRTTSVWPGNASPCNS